MRLISIHLYVKTTDTEPICIGSSMDLSFAGFFERGTIKEFINFNARLVIARTLKEQRLEVALEKGLCYSYVTSDNLGISIITDEEYPKRVAFDLIYKIMQELNDYVFTNKMSLTNIKSDTDIKFKYIDTIVKEWQDPSNKDSIMILQNELDGVTQIMKKNLQDLLKREENLDALMAKSNDLSKISVDFYKKAKSSNKKCCSMG